MEFSSELLKASSLLPAFRTVNNVLKGNAVKIVKFLVQEGELSIIAKSVMYYKGSLGKVTTNNSGAICVQYHDFTSILMTSEDAFIHITDAYVEIKTENTTIVLNRTISDISEVDTSMTNPCTFDSKKLLSSMSSILSLNHFNAVYKCTVEMNEDFMQVKYPTAWFQLGSSRIKNAITLEIASILKSYLTSKDGLLSNHKRYSVLQNTNGLVTIPTNDKIDSIDMAKSIENYNYIGSYDIGTIKPLVSYLGKTNATISFFDAAIIIETRSEAFSSKHVLGEQGEAIVPSFSFQYRLELFANVVDLFGGKFSVKKGGDLICFQEDDKIALISVKV